MEALAARQHARVYRTSGKQDVHSFLRLAVEAAGGTVLYESPYTRAPAFIGFELASGERIGLLAYLFRATRNEIRNRPTDEHRLQVRYGSEESWHSEEHPVGFDVAGVDVTAVLGVHLEAGLLIALDPLRYDPLPMGISVEFKDHHVEVARRSGWHVWERDTIKGVVREARAAGGLETLIALRPERLVDLIRFEREARSLGLDPALRHRAASVAADRRDVSGSVKHVLERDFALSSQEILDIITTRSRLATAVRGGVAEHHLHRALEQDPAATRVVAVDRDGGDFDVELPDGARVSVECKNASPNAYANGDHRVEVQKTRASKNDPASRYYRAEQFDVVAACLFSATGSWTFKFQRSSRLRRHESFPDRLAALQRVDSSWAPSLEALIRGS